MGVCKLNMLLLAAAVAALCCGLSSARVCPPNTFPRDIAKNGDHGYCVCPFDHVCTNCEKTCRVDPAPLKDRCVMTFKADCEDCSCNPGPDTGSKSMGKMRDRRQEAFCEGFATREMGRKLVDSNHTFVFVVSNGHTGTTFLGMNSVWRKHFGKVLPHGFFIAHETELDKDTVRRIAWEPDFCERAVDYVKHFKLPQMESILAALQGHTFFGSGHQVILGLVPILADMLGDQARFIRLRRNRFDTAFSFYHTKHDGPCGNRCGYCLCPMDPVARCPVQGATWHEMSGYQQQLWSVDEVECQWQAFMRSRPNLKTLEVNWDKRLGAEQLLEIARFSGMPVDLVSPKEPPKEKANKHITDDVRKAKNYTWMAEEDQTYRRLVGHTKECSIYSCVGF